jgi:hypothetical protein
MYIQLTKIAIDFQLVTYIIENMYGIYLFVNHWHNNYL